MTADNWRQLTPPRPLPPPEATETVELGEVSLHCATYGSGKPGSVLMLHGGLGAAEDFGGQISAIAEHHRVIAIDSRGHGRSTDCDEAFGYDLLASDVMRVMDALALDSAAIVGWSDGGNIALQIAIHNRDRLTKAFALGANYHISALRPSAFTDDLIGAYVAHAAAQYAEISPTPDAWETFSGKVFAMWGSQPDFSEDQLAGISTPFMIAAGVYEEAIDEAHTKRMAELIPGAQLLLIENASHFAQWQQVDAVNAAILEFLAGD